jgi:hypothetical protein
MQIPIRFQAVLWIRIRNNPNVLAGSESEKKFGFGFRHCCRMKICEKSKIKHLKEKNLRFFYWKCFFSDVQVSEHIWKQLEALFRKIWGQNISLRIRIRFRIRKKIICGSESEKMSSDPQHWFQVVPMLRIRDVLFRIPDPDPRIFSSWILRPM